RRAEPLGSPGGSPRLDRLRAARGARRAGGDAGPARGRLRRHARGGRERGAERRLPRRGGLRGGDRLRLGPEAVPAFRRRRSRAAARPERPAATLAADYSAAAAFFGSPAGFDVSPGDELSAPEPESPSLLAAPLRPERP